MGLKNHNYDLETLATGLIIGTMVLLPIVEFIMSLLGQPFCYQEGIVELFGYASFILLILNLSKRKEIEIHLSDILLIALFLFAILSLIFSKDLEQSLYGEKYDYREGITVFFSYYCVALLASRIAGTAHRKKIVQTFYVLGIIEIGVGILQYFGLWMYPPLHLPEFENNISDTAQWAFGFTEHFNFFTALVIIFTALSAGKFLICEKRLKLKYFLASAFCFFGVMTTYTRIGWLGTIGFLCFLILLGIIAKKMKVSKQELNKKGIIALIVLYIAIFAGSAIAFPNLQDNIQESVDEADGKKNPGNGRMIIWTQGLETVPKWWYVGTGLDNYKYAFYWDDPEYDGWYQDKGHNEYIHILVTQGVFATITLLTMICYNLFTSAKRYLLSTAGTQEAEITFLLLVMYAGYLSQALVNSSVTNVAIYNWIITGLLLYSKDKKVLLTIEDKKNENQ